MSLCVLAGVKMLTLATTMFTLSWTHSVEKTRWEEHWLVTPAGLEIVEARVRGSGAGMDPPPDAVFRNGWYVYRPHLPPQKALHLAASGATVGGWALCAGAECLTIGAEAGEAVTLEPCAAKGG